MSDTDLKEGEPHPSAEIARQWILEYSRRNHVDALFKLMEALYSSGLSGNRTAQVCAETLRRLLHAEPVSDRYLLGLAWFIRDMEEFEAKEKSGPSASELKRFVKIGPNNQVRLVIDNQSFNINHACDSKEDAGWMRDMLVIGLGKLAKSTWRK